MDLSWILPQIRILCYMLTGYRYRYTYLPDTGNVVVHCNGLEQPEAFLVLIDARLADLLWMNVVLSSLSKIIIGFFCPLCPKP